MSEKIVVTVNEGRIRGTKNRSVFSGVEFYSFYGIPYGQPTGKQARFKDPVKIKPWKNVHDGTVPRDGCLQFALRVKRITGSEDCLYNNIHTPKLPSNGDEPKAVIVNIHPGGFTHGSPDSWYYGSPDYIMHHDIVYVSIGYRLHILGFLNLDMKECSGNQGIKDIILGLKWITDNIRAFGGDPKNITLLGSSSGASLINCLMVSPVAKGLFHKAIIMGGSMFNLTIGCREESLSLAIQIAEALGYDANNKDEKKKLLSFMKKLQVLDFISFKAEKVLQKNLATVFPGSPFEVTQDKGENAVFPVSPRKLITSTARIPLLIGLCDKEAFLGFCQGLKKTTMANFKTTFRQNCFGWAHWMTDQQIDLMFEDIKSFYLNGNGIENASLSTLIDIQTDGAYSDIYESLIDVISTDLPSSVYVYKFEFESKGELNTLKDQVSFLLDEPVKGTFHASDYSYWACMIDQWGNNDAKIMNDRSRKMVERFTKLLTTFAKNGDPNYQDLEVKWKPTTPENPCYMSINDSLNLVDGKLNDERMRFWEGLKEKYGKK